MNDQDKIDFLNLQRAALIDTQTLFQILISKGLCTLEDITSIRANIENGDENVRQIDRKIAELKGQSIEEFNEQALPKLSGINKEDLVKQISDLRKFLEGRKES